MSLASHCRNSDDGWTPRKLKAFSPGGTRDKSNHKDFVIRWLQSKFYIGEEGSVPKSTVFKKYKKLCVANHWKPTSANSFGKFVHKAFPTIQSSRKGPRGKSRHHYKYLNIIRSDDSDRCSIDETSLPATPSPASSPLSSSPPTPCSSGLSSCPSSRSHSPTPGLLDQVNEVLNKDQQTAMQPPRREVDTNFHLANFTPINREAPTMPKVEPVGFRPISMPIPLLPAPQATTSTTVPTAPPPVVHITPPYMGNDKDFAFFSSQESNDFGTPGRESPMPPHPAAVLPMPMPMGEKKLLPIEEEALMMGSGMNWLKQGTGSSFSSCSSFSFDLGAFFLSPPGTNQNNPGLWDAEGFAKIFSLSPASSFSFPGPSPVATTSAVTSSTLPGTTTVPSTAPAGQAQNPESVPVTSPALLNNLPLETFKMDYSIYMRALVDALLLPNAKDMEIVKPIIRVFWTKAAQCYVGVLQTEEAKKYLLQVDRAVFGTLPEMMINCKYETTSHATTINPNPKVVRAEFLRSVTVFLPIWLQAARSDVLPRNMLFKTAKVLNKFSTELRKKTKAVYGTQEK